MVSIFYMIPDELKEIFLEQCNLILQEFMKFGLDDIQRLVGYRISRELVATIESIISKSSSEYYAYSGKLLHEVACDFFGLSVMSPHPVILKNDWDIFEEQISRRRICI